MFGCIVVKLLRVVDCVECKLNIYIYICIYLHICIYIYIHIYMYTKSLAFNTYLWNKCA